MPQNHTFKTSDGLSLAYSTAGTGPLLIAQSPGWGIGGDYIQKYFEPLTEKYTLLTLVSRGTPPSERAANASKMSSADMAEDLEALRVHLKLEKMTLIGHSNGGAIALSYAAKYPSRVEKLVLISAELVGFDDSETFQRFMKTRSADPRYRSALAAFPKAYAAQTDEELRDALYFAHPELYAEEWQDMIAEGTAYAWPFSAQQKADKANRVMPELERVQARTLILAGDEDALCSVRTARRIQEGVNGSTVAEFMDCGHMIWCEKREKFFETVLGFLGD